MHTVHPLRFLHCETIPSNFVLLCSFIFMYSYNTSYLVYYHTPCVYYNLKCSFCVQWSKLAESIIILCHVFMTLLCILLLRLLSCFTVLSQSVRCYNMWIYRGRDQKCFILYYLNVALRWTIKKKKVESHSQVVKYRCTKHHSTHSTSPTSWSVYFLSL